MRVRRGNLKNLEKSGDYEADKSFEPFWRINRRYPGDWDSLGKGEHEESILHMAGQKRGQGVTQQETSPERPDRQGLSFGQ